MQGWGGGRGSFFRSVVQTSDVATTGINYYNFHVEPVDGAGDYAFVVYEGGCSSSHLDCGSGSTSDPEGAGYTAYQFFAQDVGDGGHAIPGDTRACSTGSAYYNNGEDLSSDYYIHVILEGLDAPGLTAVGAR